MAIDERRLNTRLNLRIPLRFRPISADKTPEQRAESVNISPSGLYFATEFPLKVGMPVEVFLRMPQELTGQAPGDVRCTGRVVHVQPDTFLGGKTGVGVHIERFERMAGAERWTS